ncbi:copper resistance protein B [Dyella agri]|uniref:Copper resistance protein B n=1 Tax=Dyella agri TaxID=1926869 RepID=A0ABW8KDJ7_9GAMM
MSRDPLTTVIALRRSLWLAAGLLVLAAPGMAGAQTTPAPASSSATTDMGSMPGMDMRPMSGMSMPASAAQPSVGATKAGKHHRKPAAKPAQHMPGMSHGATDAMSGMAHDAMPAMASPARPASNAGMEGMGQHAMPDMHPDTAKTTGQDAMPGMGGMPHDAGTPAATTMGPMQGGKPSADARSPDYSDGVDYGSMRDMDMRDNAPLGMLLFDQLEAFHGKDSHGQAWTVQGWYGNDNDKLWLRSEGERSRGGIENGDVEALWSHAVATFWDVQLGVRQELGDGPSRHWAAFGIQGLAPYGFDLEATGYIGPSGRTAARLRAEYELLFTQRLILQPEFEVNAYGQSDPARRLGGGLSDARFGLRLRYEIRREFAPYVGVVWTRRFGGTADFARDDRQAIFDRQWVAGIRIWF